MPATYEPIATTTLGSAASSITFSSIAASWTDLRLVLIGTASGGTGTRYLKFNSSSTGYSNTWLLGNGSAASSGRSTSYPRLDLNSQDVADTVLSMDTVDIFSYAGSTYKTSLITSSHDENGSGQVSREVGLWSNTAAITQIDLYIAGASWASGTTATLYGIKSA